MKRWKDYLDKLLLTISIFAKSTSDHKQNVQTIICSHNWFSCSFTWSDPFVLTVGFWSFSLVRIIQQPIRLTISSFVDAITFQTNWCVKAFVKKWGSFCFIRQCILNCEYLQQCNHKYIVCSIDVTSKSK